MSTLFFLFSLFVAWSAWNLYNPNFRHPQVSTASFLVGWLTGELAPHVIFWQAMIVAFFVLWGAVWGFFGAIGFLACVAGWAAMAYHYFDSFRARELAEDALADGLGDGYYLEIDDDYAQQFGDELDTDLLRHPFRQSDPKVELIKDVPFGDFRQTLDIRRERNSSKEKRPVLLQIHGGAWTENYGSKNEQGIPLMNHMAKRGWICIANSYRLSPRATFPEHIVDCKQALVWIKENIAEYGGDPDFVVVTGGSAGGHLSSLMATSANFAAFQPGFEDKDTSVQGAVPFYGVYDLADRQGVYYNDGLLSMLEGSMMKLPINGNEDAYDEASPIWHVNADLPPFMIIHGDSDSLVPVEEGRMLSEAMAEVSNDKVVYLELPGAQHAFDIFPSPRSEFVKFGIERFLAWTHTRYLREQAAS